MPNHRRHRVGPTARIRLACSFLAAVLAMPAWALYDERPDASLAAVQGTWQGTLTYRDYQEPHRLVTLPTRLYVALGAPSALVLDYVFADGPGKTVYSYERMEVDATARTVAWTTGAGPAVRSSLASITSDSVEGPVRTIVFERRDAAPVRRYRLELSPDAFALSEDEVDAAGQATFRNRYAFKRAAD